MTERPDGNYDVDPNEQITVNVTKSLPNCAAALNLSGAVLSCRSAQFPVCQNCFFTAPANSGAQVTLTMSLDFQSDAQGNFAPGDMYTVQFSGNGGNVHPIHVSPPPALGMFFIFFVR